MEDQPANRQKQLSPEAERKETERAGRLEKQESGYSVEREHDPVGDVPIYPHR